MNKVIKNIHVLFWGCIPLFLLYGILQLHPDNVIDINIDDTIYVAAIIHVMVFQSIFFFLIGLIYFWMYKSHSLKPTNHLTLVHVFLTFAGIIVLLVLSLYRKNLVPFKNYGDYKFYFEMSNLYKQIVTFSYITIFSAQLLLLLNLTISFFRKKL